MESKLPLEIFERYFSGYSAHMIEREGVVYATLEHAYHCLRYADQNMIDEIRSARSPYLAWSISQTYKQFQIAGFSERKVEVMKELIDLKITQHEDVRQALLDSADLYIVKHITTGSPADGFWDDGADGKGLNHVGRLWMEAREGLAEKNKTGRVPGHTTQSTSIF